MIKFGGMMKKRQSCVDAEAAAADTYLHRESLSSSDALPDGWMDGCSSC